MKIIALFLPLFLFAGIIQNNIAKIYKKAYPTIKISKITLNHKFSHIKSIDTSYINIKRPIGIVKINNNSFVSYKITATIKVLKTTQTLHKGDMLTTTNTNVSIIKFKNFYATPLLTFHKNLMSTSYIPQNNIIYSYMVAKPYLVKRGDIIQIISNSGNIEILLQGTALQNGRKNDSIKVKINSTIYNVKIIGEDKAKL